VNTIRRITPAGVVTTLAGTPNTGGTTDGTGAIARFSNPNGIRVTPSGAIYLADNNRIRSITPTGDVSTIYTGATLLAYVAVDSSGAVFATDLGYKAAVKIDLAAGTQTALASGFQNPVGICVAPIGTLAAGTLYVGDEFGYTVSAVSSSGVLTVLAGTGGQYGGVDGTGAAARFYSPTGMTIDGMGTIFLADPGNNDLRKITSAGVVTTFAGAPALTGDVDDTGAAARFSAPAGLATDTNGDLYVGDVGNAAIRKVTPAGVVAHALPAGVKIGLPQTLTIDTAGNFYVSSRSAIARVSPSGTITTIAGDPNGQSGYMDGTGPAARFNSPAGIALDAAGNLYVADAGNFVIRKVTPGGAVTTLAGQPGVAGQSDGIGSAAQFTLPGVIAIDDAGNLYLTDGHALRTINPDATVTTLAGSQTSGNADGTGAAAKFNSPYGLALRVGGSLYVSDTFNHEIRKVTVAGVVTTIAGAPGRTGVAPGVLPASLNLPLGIVYFGTTLYIVDSAENSLLAITYAP
jgi:sugar lactone lactonase YvrE